MIVRTHSNDECDAADSIASGTPSVRTQAVHDALQTEQPVLIISGMHRSGTSLMAALCQTAGLHIR